MIKCPHCKIGKPPESYGPDKSQTSGRKSWCKSCLAIATRQQLKRRLEADPGGFGLRWRLQKRIYDRNRIIRKRCNADPEQVSKLLSAQAGLCAICMKPESDPRKTVLSIDHDHSTGVIRGMLCDACNRGLGLFRDRIDLLVSAAEYLTRVAERDKMAS